MLQASPAALSASRHNPLWEGFIKRDMLWAWELWLLGKEELEGLEYKAVYMWLNKATVPRHGMGGPFLALANRRRIWDACEQLASHYHRRLQMRTLEAPEPAILQSAVCRHRLWLTDEQVPDDFHSLQRTLFFYSQEEPKHKPVIYETYWENDGSLIGLGVVVDKQKRIFGRDGADSYYGTKKSTIRLESGSRTTELGLLVATTDLNSGGVTTLPKITAVGVALNETQGVKLEGGWVLSSEFPCTNSALLRVSDRAELVGVEGHIDQVIRCSPPLSTPGFFLFVFSVSPFFLFSVMPTASVASLTRGLREFRTEIYEVSDCLRYPQQPRRRRRQRTCNAVASTSGRQTRLNTPSGASRTVTGRPSTYLPSRRPRRE
jgi:hypothetical protein